MRIFLRSRRFKILLAVVAVLLVVMILTVTISKYASPQSSFISVITTPVQKFTSFISGKVDDITNNFANSSEISAENEELKSRISELEQQIVDYEKMKQENEYYKQFLDLKQENKDFELEEANVIARDPNELLYKTFTIDKGSLNGVAKNDPVVVQGRYLVGYVYEVSPAQSTVITVLNPNINISAVVNRTSDTGSISGDVKLAENGMCRMTGLSRTSGASAGDRIVTTSLGGTFPDGLIVGTITEIAPSGSDISNYAVIDPSADFDDLRFVMVIKGFEGQSNAAAS